MGFYEGLNPALETMEAGYDVFGDQAHQDRVYTKEQSRLFGDLARPGSTWTCGLKCKFNMSARLGLSVVDVLGIAAGIKAGVKAGVKGAANSSRSKMARASAEESATASGQGAKKSGTAGKGSGAGGGGSGKGGKGSWRRFWR